MIRFHRGYMQVQQQINERIDEAELRSLRNKQASVAEAKALGVKLGKNYSLRVGHLPSSNPPPTTGGRNWSRAALKARVTLPKVGGK